MKKKLFLALLAPMTLLPIAGCSTNSAMKITYGTYVTTEDAKNNDAIEINHSQLFEKMDSNSKFNKENFLIVVAPTNGCLCWTKFQPVLKQFIKETHYLVYTIKITEFSEENSDFGIKMQQGHVSMAIVKGTKIVKQYLSSTIFDDAAALKAEINKYVRAPEMYFIDQKFLEYTIKKTRDTALIEFYRSTCSDCKNSNAYAVWDFAHNNLFKTKMYIIDMDNLDFGIPKYETNEDGSYVLNKYGQMIQTEEYKQEYQVFKDAYSLSNKFSSSYGYNNGYVPTFQYYERGEVKDASVYFNDTVEKVGDDLIVTDSFYSSERVKYLKYAADVETNILKGLKLSIEDVDDYTAYGYGYMWKAENASQYHKPLFEAFMKKYALN